MATIGAFFAAPTCGSATFDYPRLTLLSPLAVAVTTTPNATRQPKSGATTSQEGLDLSRSRLHVSRIPWFPVIVPIFNHIDGITTTNTPIVDAYVQDDSSTDSPQYRAATTTSTAADTATPEARLAAVRASTALAVQQSTNYNYSHYPGQSHSDQPGPSFIANAAARFHLSLFLDDDLFAGDSDQVGKTSISVRLYKVVGPLGDPKSYQDVSEGKPVTLPDAFPPPNTSNLHQHEFTLPYRKNGGKSYYLTTDLQPKSASNDLLKPGHYAIGIQRDGVLRTPVYANFDVQ